MEYHIIPASSIICQVLRGIYPRAPRYLANNCARGYSESEYRFMEILWEEEQVSSMDMVRFCSERLNWKKSTTYMVISNK